MPRIHQQEEIVLTPFLKAQGKRAVTEKLCKGTETYSQPGGPAGRQQGNKHHDFISLLPSNLLPVPPKSQKPEDTRDGMIPSIDITPWGTKQRGMMEG